MRIDHKLYAFGFHLIEASVEDSLLHLELGDAVPEQTAGTVCLFVNCNPMSGAIELLRGGEACRT